MKVAQSPRLQPLTLASIVAVVFIILILISEVSAGVLSSGLLNFYLQGRGSGVDGVVVTCAHTYSTFYFDVNEIPPPYPVCPYGAPIGDQTYTTTIPGVTVYPVYNGLTNLLLNKTDSNSSMVVSMYGLGTSQTMEEALQSALVSGSLPTSTSSYQAIVPDTVADAYGLNVGDKLTISGSGQYCASLCAGGGQYPEFNATVLGRSVTISGIVSSSKLNSEFNIEGVPVFVGDGAAGPTSVLLGYRLAPNPVVGKCQGSSAPSQMWGPSGLFNYTGKWPDPCTVGPELLAIVSNNLFSDFFSHYVGGPNAILFRLQQQQPATPAGLLSTLNEIQAEYGNLPGYGNFTGPTGTFVNFTLTSRVYLDWRSAFGLVWAPPTVGLINTPKLVPIDNLSQVSTAQPPYQFGTPLVVIEQSQVVSSLQTVDNESYVLALDALALGLLVELGVFTLTRRRFIIEIEIYKANGLSSSGALWLLLSKQRAAIILVGSGILLSSAVGAILQVGVVLPIILGGGFFGLMIAEFAVLVKAVYRYKGLKYLARGKVG